MKRAIELIMVVIVSVLIGLFMVVSASALAFDCSGIPNGQPVFEGDKLVGCIGGDYKYETPYEALVIIKTEQKTRRHMTDCNHCDMYSCTAIMCPMATYHYNEYSIGTSDGKILFTIEDTEKVEE